MRGATLTGKFLSAPRDEPPVRPPRLFLARFGVVAQIAFAICFAAAFVLSVWKFGPRAPEKPLSETAHAHYHVHGPGIVHGHVHADFTSGGHTHVHEHPLVDEAP